MYFAGIDGGQSSTSAVIADQSGRILGRGTAGPADEVNQSAQSTRLHGALVSALGDALRHANLPADTSFLQIVAGVSGYQGKVYGVPPQLNGALSLMHDAPIAHAGAFAGGAGVIVIAGTGSVAYARDARGAEAMVGGWGYLFGDEGSAFFIAKTAISKAFKDADAGQSGVLMGVVLKHFQMPSLRALARAFYSGEIGRDAIASFASVVIHAAESGNERGANLVEKAADALVMLARNAMDRAQMHNAAVAFTGGLLQQQTMREAIGQRMRASMPLSPLVSPKYDAAQGALLLAYQRAGITVEALH